MLTTGFDLDMTLVDSRPGIKATYEALSAETGVWIDADLAVTRLGPPLETELANWAPPQETAALADRYRALYPSIALPLIEAMPGASDAVAAAREGGPVLLITGKAQANAELHVRQLGLDFDRVVGDVWRFQKTQVLLDEAAGLYVGDHVHDMEAAAAASIPGLGVTTGPCAADDLLAAGASAVIDDLGGFRSWLADRSAGLQ